MKAIKRTVAAILATLMLATSTSFTLAAEEYSDAEAVAVAKVNAAQVMTGTDNGFEPSKTLTRAEAAAIMVRMKGISESTVKQNAGQTLFTDVAASNWASGYINVASNYGIIKGVGANLFAPEKEVTVAEFYTMAIRALNAGQLVEAEGTWPTNYVNFAIENGLAEDVAQIYSATATRLTAAVIAANTLEANMWAKKSVRTNQEITWEETADQLAEKLLNLDTRVWNTTTGKYEALTLPVNTVSNIDKTVNSYDVVKSFDLSSVKVGMTYEYWTNKDGDIVGLWIPVNNDSVEFTEIKKISTDGKEITLVVDGKEKKYDIDITNIGTETSKVPVIVINEAKQNSATAPADVAALKTLLAPTKNLDGVAYIDNGVVKQIYITTFNHYGIVDEVTDKRITFKSSDVTIAKKTGTGAYDLSAEPFRLDKEDYEYFLTKDGKAIEFSSLKEDDAIRYYTYGDKIVAEVIEAAAEGKITNLNETDGFIKIAGTKYDYIEDVTGLALEKEVKIFTNQANKVVMYQLIEDAKSDVAVLKSVRNVTNKYSEETVEVVLVYTDGTESEVLSLDVEETLKKNNKSHAATLSAVFDKTTKVLNVKDGTELRLSYKLGQTVCYSVSGTELVIKPVSDEYTTIADATASTPTTATLAIKENSKSYVTVGTAKAYVDKDTKFMLVKSDKEYAYKVEMVDFEDLDFDTTTLTNAYVIDYDADNKSVNAVVIIADSLPRAKATNYAYITRVSEIKYDDKEAYELEVIYADGTSGELISTQKEFGSDFDDFAKDQAWDFSLNGKLVTSDSDEVTDGTIAADTKIEDIDFANNEIKFVGLDDWYQISEDVLVLFQDGSKYSVKDLADIDEFITGDKEFSTIVTTYTDLDDDNNVQICILVFKTTKVEA